MKLAAVLILALSISGCVGVTRTYLSKEPCLDRGCFWDEGKAQCVCPDENQYGPRKYKY